MSKPCLPIVDFSPLNIGKVNSGEVSKLMEQEDLLSFAKQLFHTFKQYGCFYLKNPNISESKCRDIKKLLNEVCKFPEETKKRFGRRPDVCVHGYATRVDERPEDHDSGERYETFVTCPRKATVWPDEVNGFKCLALELSSDFQQLSYHILDLLGIGMELKNPKFLRESHVDGLGELRKTIYRSYPDDFELEPDQLRFFAHCDLGSVTIIHQDKAGGLQVKCRSTGDWFDVKPIPNTVVVMCGQILQRWTSDRIRAPLHRVIIPTARDSRCKDRFSVSYFPIPESDFIIEPLDGSNKYIPLTVSECFSAERCFVEL